MICSLRKNIFISCLKYSCRNQVRSHSSAESRARWQISRRRHPGSVRAAARTPCSSSQTWACPSREARNTAAGRSFCCWGRCRSTSRDRLCMATLAFVPLWNAAERYWWMNVEPIIYKYSVSHLYCRTACCLLQEGWSMGTSTTFLSLPSRKADCRCKCNVGSDSSPLKT